MAESGTARDYRICRMLARYVLCKPQHCFSAQSEADLISGNKQIHQQPSLKNAYTFTYSLLSFYV